MPVPNPTLIYRITHVNNVRWILANGLHCARSQHNDPNFIQIGNPGLIGRRSVRTVPIPPGGVMDDYVPFYFGTHSAMMYNIHTGYGVQQVPQRNIAYLVSSVQHLQAAGIGFVFTDRHAYVANAHYSSNPQDLTRLDWVLIAGRDFKRDPNRLDKIERRAAELLVHQHLPVGALSEIACYDQATQQTIMQWVTAQGGQTTVQVRPGWYF